MRKLLGLVCALGVLSVADSVYALNNTGKGAVAGAVGGALVAGPVGLVVGGAGGALIGHDWARRPHYRTHRAVSYHHVSHPAPAAHA